MKTVFKVGMEVWDKTISPKRGKVIEVFTDYKYDFPIKVEFENNVKVRYTTDGCFVKNKGTVPTLSTSDYSVETKGFEQKALAPTFEEVLVNCDKRYPPNIRADVNYKEIYPTKELSDAAEALRKLLFLRDYYNKGWQPNWIDQYQEKYCIINFLEEIDFINYSKKSKFEEYKFYHILTFKTEQIRDKFLEEQKELLEIAKPLL